MEGTNQGIGGAGAGRRAPGKRSRAEALAKSLTEFSDGNAKFWMRDVDKQQQTGYRYSNFDPRFNSAGNPVSGSPKLGIHQDGGWYVGFEAIDSSAAARTRFQLPPESTAKFRLEFDWDAVKNNVKIPRGTRNQAEWFEPFCKDFPENGSGLGGQVMIDGVEAPIKAIWDISGSIPVKIY